MHERALNLILKKRIVRATDKLTHLLHAWLWRKIFIQYLSFFILPTKLAAVEQ